MKEWKSHFWHGNMKDLKGEKPKNFHEKRVVIAIFLVFMFLFFFHLLLNFLHSLSFSLPQIYKNSLLAHLSLLHNINFSWVTAQPENLHLSQ